MAERQRRRPARVRKADEGDDGAALLRAVFQQPDDDGARLVYGDWLQERGDPRGELIVLQCNNKRRTGEQERRAAELLAQHGAAWARPLAAILDEETLEFRRGFLARATVRRVVRGKLKLEVVGAAEWATVEELTFRYNTTLPVTRLLLDPAMSSLRVVRRIDGEVLLALCQGERDLPIEELAASIEHLLERPPSDDTSWVVNAAARQVLARCARLPRLRRLTLEAAPGEVPDVEWLFVCPLATRLSELRLDNWGGDLGHYVAAAAHPTALERLVVRRQAMSSGDAEVFSLRRGRDGNLSALRAQLRAAQQVDEQIVDLADQLRALAVGALTSVVVVTPRPLDTDEHGELREAARRQARVAELELEVIA